MSQPMCLICKKPKATTTCEICEEPLCKSCVQFLEPDTFTFLSELPDELSHDRYCEHCYASTVIPALDSYEEVMERAKQVFVYFTTQRAGIPLTGRSKAKVKVESCPDRDETILRLAFFAAEQKFNALIEVEVIAEKVRNAGYQKSKWRGVGEPANVDAAKVTRNDRQERLY